MFSFTASSDGKGDTDSAAKEGKSTKRMGPSYGAPYPGNSIPGFNGLIYSCSILPSVHQTRCIRIKPRPLPQRPFHWSHSIKDFPPSSYSGIYEADPVQAWGPLRARQGSCLRTALKLSTQRRLCPPLFEGSFWSRPVWTRSDHAGCQVREEDWERLAIGEATGMVWRYWYPLQQVLSMFPNQIVHSSALKYTIAFTHQMEKEMKWQRLPLTKVIFRWDTSMHSSSRPLTPLGLWKHASWKLKALLHPVMHSTRIWNSSKTRWSVGPVAPAVKVSFRWKIG